MLVIFDRDGVLIDSEAIFCAVDAEALTELGYSIVLLYLGMRSCLPGISTRMEHR